MPATTSPPASVASPKQALAPQSQPLIVLNTYDGNAATISLVDLGGRTVASTTRPATHHPVDWATGGPGGAYWVEAGRLHVLARDGSVSDAGPLPTTWFRVGPDGSVAYAANTPVAGSSNGANRAQLLVLRDGTAHLLAERVADPDHPSSDAPDVPWGYEAMAWNRTGLVIARTSLGGCGCGPFGMQTTYGFTATVNPDSGIATPITADSTCPLSGIANDGTAVCFHTPQVPASKDEGRGVDELRIIRNASVVQRFDMSRSNAAGDAVFSPDATQLAYATVAAGTDCGAWESQTALHVLDLQQGTAKVIGAVGLQPLAWIDGGRLLAKQTLDAPGGMASVRTVVLDVASGHSTTLTTVTQQGVQVGGVSAAA